MEEGLADDRRPPKHDIPDSIMFAPLRGFETKFKVTTVALASYHDWEKMRRRLFPAHKTKRKGLCASSPWLKACFLRLDVMLLFVVVCPGAFPSSHQKPKVLSCACGDIWLANLFAAGSQDPCLRHFFKYLKTSFHIFLPSWRLHII